MRLPAGPEYAATALSGSVKTRRAALDWELWLDAKTLEVGCEPAPKRVPAAPLDSCLL